MPCTPDWSGVALSVWARELCCMFFWDGNWNNVGLRAWEGNRNVQKRNKLAIDIGSSG